MNYSKFYNEARCFTRPLWFNEKLGGITGKGCRIAVIDSGCDSNLFNDSRIEKGISFVKENTDFVFERNDNYSDKI
jgi:hypothetical protein